MSAMMELLSNLLWLAVAAAAVYYAPRRTPRVMIALALLIALLFPIISVSDDIICPDAIYNVFSVVVVALFALLAAFVALNVIEPERRSRALLLVATLSDPRSPPRA
jgi:hypothetical protein